MRLFIASAAIVACAAASLCAGAAPPAAAATSRSSGPASAATSGPASMKLVWSDEFDYQGLPDPARWDYEEGFIRNNELQYYTRARKENARVEGGCLIIEGRKEQYPNARHDPAAKGDWKKSPQSAQYTSASLTTWKKADWLYGRIEMRARLPRGKGVWPAFWMMGVNRDKVGWPACGEIDIMEFVGKEPKYIHGTLHWASAGDGKHASSGGKTELSEPWADFHVYAVDWTPRRVDFLLDGKVYRSVELDQSKMGQQLARPHYILVNLALGGSWGGAMDDSALPQQYIIDYIRVYQSAPTSGPSTMAG
jgi:beta-glucanase (GH16 family)